MILLLLIISLALGFFLGRFIPKREKKSETEKAKPSQTETEIINFLNYDGTDV